MYVLYYIYIYIYMYIYIYIYTYIYPSISLSLYIYIYRERDMGSFRCALIGVPWCLRMLSLFSTFESASRLTVSPKATPSPPTKSFDFGGFDSSKLLILKGGNSHVR